MSEKDTVTKEYMKDSVVFADAFNYYLYDGKQVIKPEQLKPLDTTAIILPYGEDSSTVPIQKYRDILKVVTAMNDSHAAYLLLGIENQSQMHYAMPVRNMLYDAIQYAAQVDSTNKSHRHSTNKPESQAEFLSGFYRTDKLLPVITLTVYFGADEWTAPKDLHEMLDADEDILKYINNYNIHLISPEAIPEEDFSKFKSELSLVLKYVKYSKDKKKLNIVVSEDDAYRHISRRTANMINVVTGSELKFRNGEESVDMCEAIQDMRKEALAEGVIQGVKAGRQEGIKEGMKTGIIKGAREEDLNIARKMISSGKVNYEDIAEYTGLSLEEIRSLAGEQTV